MAGTGSANGRNGGGSRAVARRTTKTIAAAGARVEVRKTYKDLGVQAIFEKPFDVAHLRAAVDTLAGA